ncbi:MAG: single-stranded-DNA-specific exonuclease RecJ [Planctomycetota bacterium]|nr:single-stranded-DNA-specific exonuclease RecJ [Planctomycetota bacterium]
MGASPDGVVMVQQGLTARWRSRGVPASPSLPLVERVAATRGLRGEAFGAFLHPELTHLHDPSLMPGLEAAAERLVAAVRSGERIAIYGDYDVDGISAAAILFHLIRALRPDADVVTYVPHRLEEGYGLNAEALCTLAREGARVIVSVDCGVTARVPAEALRSLAPDVDLIITDHHNLPANADQLPPAFAVVHPRLADLPGFAGAGDSRYPFGELCGAGVAYKLAWRLATLWCGTQRVTPELRRLLLELLALASMGVVADVVPLVGENRVLARFGLGRIRGSTLPGLRELVDVSGLGNERVDAADVGFKLGPRINACGRLGHAREALELLTTATPERAREIAEMLTKRNNERRNIEKRIFEQACEMVQSAGMHLADRRGIVLAHDDWHPGVVGIVCSRLVERFHRPAILLKRDAECCHGSGRSIDGFSLHGAIESCREHLLSFGGHDMAAGLKVRADALEAFAAGFIDRCNAGIDASRLCPEHCFDADAALPELTLEALDQLERFAPFGRENPGVTLRVRGVRVATRPELLGSTGRHVAFHVAHQGRVVRVLGWDMAGTLAEADRQRGAPALSLNDTIDVLLTPEINAFRGTRSVQGTLLDFAPAREAT